MEKTHLSVWLAAGIIFVVVGASLGLIFVLSNRISGEPKAYPTLPVVTDSSMSSTPTASASSTGTTNTSATPGVTITEPAPTLAKITELNIDGGNQWLFAVNDGEAKIALSTEQGNTVAMSRLDLKNLSERPSWKRVASSADTAGEGIADHWHIFAHDAHWIAFSVTGANRSFLLKLDKNFERLALTQVANKDEVSNEEIAKLGVPSGGQNDPKGSTNRPVTTNDMFLVAEPDGVAVSHMVPGVGAKIYRFDTAGQAVGTALLGGPEYIFNNGSSAEPTESGFTIFATETLNMVQQGAIKLINTNPAWQPLSVTTLLDEERINLAMSTAVTLSGGYRLLTARAVSGAYPRGEMPPPAQPGQGLSDDSGAIVRYLFDANNTLVSRTVLKETKGNRPHTTLISKQLITTWDGGGRVTLRIDEID